jgi:hypothetical protein
MDEVGQLSDGDEIMVKDGERISKFSKQAMGLGKYVYAEDGNAPLILKKTYLVYDKYVGQESVYPLKNGAPRIMTKYNDKPNTYENGEIFHVSKLRTGRERRQLPRSSEDSYKGPPLLRGVAYRCAYRGWS